MRRVVVGAGSNLGARESSIRGAAALLGARPGIVVEEVSPLYETEPLGPPQPHYLNGAYRLRTDLSPHALLQTLLRTERRLGRRRSETERWGPRSIDLDLLWDEAGAHQSPGLRVPHVELEQRTFALAPLLDVMPSLRAAFGAKLDRLGGAPSAWSRAAIVERGATDHGYRADVEADSLPDACALAVTPLKPRGRPWSTIGLKATAGADGFFEALRRVLRTGFEVQRATVSHCSNGQWALEFHGGNAGLPVDVDVRCRPTSGSRREQLVALSVSLHRG